MPLLDDFKNLGKKKSADQAKKRLVEVLIHDRTDLTAEDMASLRSDLIAVISKYIEIDPSEVRIAISQVQRENRLTADIPIKPVHRQPKGS